MRSVLALFLAGTVLASLPNAKSHAQAPTDLTNAHLREHRD
jgi:hypothetical protein